jgi:OOP family OmpA-OmpF porin
MKNKLQIGGVLAAIATGVFFSTAVLAHEAGKANDSYVGSAGGHYITDSSGDCVRTSRWKKEDMTVDCGAEPVVEAKKAPPPPPPPPPPAEPVYEKTTLSAGALFDFNSATIKPEGEKALEAVAENIRSKGASVVDIDIIGHTDSVGPEEYNQQLSVRRATAVRDHIVSKYPNVDPSIIDVSGKGESSPVADNKTAEGRAQNRRVEVNVGVKVQQ